MQIDKTDMNISVVTLWNSKFFIMLFTISDIWIPYCGLVSVTEKIIHMKLTMSCGKWVNVCNIPVTSPHGAEVVDFSGHGGHTSGDVLPTGVSDREK